MLATLLSIMVVLLFLNFPMMIPLMLAPVVVMLIFNPNLNMDLLMGQLLTGISSSV